MRLPAALHSIVHCIPQSAVFAFFVDRIRSLRMKFDPSDFCTWSRFGNCAKCCVFFSPVAIVFHVFIGVLVSSQPEFVLDIEDPPVARRAVFGAAALYLAVFVVCLTSWYKFGQRSDNIENRPLGRFNRSSGNQFELKGNLRGRLETRLLPSESESSEDTAPLIRK